MRFKKARGGGVRADLDAVEADVLSAVAGDLLELLGEQDDADPDPLAALVGLSDGPVDPPEDPALARLLADPSERERLSRASGARARAFHLGRVAEAYEEVYRAEIARRAKRYGLPVVAIVGTVGKDARINHEHGIDAYVSILQSPSTLEQAIDHACDQVTVCAEDVMRLIVMGRNMVLEDERTTRVG